MQLCLRVKVYFALLITFSDEGIEQLRDHCCCVRDLAIIDLLYSTGIRVGELVNLNIKDVDFEARECVVFGKGDKERALLITFSEHHTFPGLKIHIFNV